MKKYNTLKNKKDYEKFLIEVPNEIEKLCQLIGKIKLDFEEEEVIKVSRIFIDFKREGVFDNKLKRMLLVYVGELFKKYFGGKWNFTGLKSDSWAVNEPVITHFKNEGMRMSPSEWIWELFKYNNPNSLNESIQYKKDFDKKTDDVFSKIFTKKKKK